LLYILCSCTQHPQQILSRAEQLIEQRPDSAYYLLDSLQSEAGNYSKPVRMHFYLLFAQAQNKTNHSLAGNDYKLKDVVNYYNLWGNAIERMKANYMLGCVYRDEGNAPMALKFYRDAVEIADTSSTSCDFKTLSRIYGQIATLFHKQRSPMLELEAQRKAVDYAWRAKDTLAAVIFYGNICLSYHMLNQMDSALYYSKKASSMFKDIGRRDLAARTLGLDIDIYLRQKNYERVKQTINEYERYSGFFDGHGDIQKGLESYYNEKGQYYEGIGLLDSAEYYYRKVLRFHPTKNAEEVAYKGLLSLYHQLKVVDSIAKYSDLYCQTNDSVSFSHSADEITRMQALYNYDESERRAVQQEKAANSYKITIFVILLIIAFCTYIAYRFVRKQKLKQKQEIIKANTAYSLLLTQYNKAQEDFQFAQQGLDVYKMSKEQEILRLQQELSLYQEEEQQKKWDAEQAMLHSTIVTHLHKIASRAVKASELEWKDLNCFVLNRMSDFLDKICDERINLTEKEIRICILARLHFIPTEMAALLDLSKQRITNIRTSANRKLFNEEGSRSFEANIHNI